MNRRYLPLLVIAAAALVLGVAIGVWPHSAGDQACGSAFAPKVDEAASYDQLVGGYSDYGPQCSQSISSARPWAFGALGLGAVTCVAAVAVASLGGARASSKDLHRDGLPEKR